MQSITNHEQQTLVFTDNLNTNVKTAYTFAKKDRLIVKTVITNNKGTGFILGSRLKYPPSNTTSSTQMTMVYTGNNFHLTPVTVNTVLPDTHEYIQEILLKEHTNNP